MKTVPKVTVVGPLGPVAGGFRAELARLGYTPGSIEVQMALVGRLSRWLGSEQLELSAVDERSVTHFLAVTDWAAKRVPTVRSFESLLAWLRSEHLVPLPSAEAMTPIDELLARYDEWLVKVRGLSARTIERYLGTARRFLEQRAASTCTATGCEGLSGSDLNEFLRDERARGLGVGSLKGRVGELAAVLRFLHVAGVIPVDLAPAVPSVGGWRDAELPPRLTADHVRSMLDSCDRATLTGRRDFAILTVLARLGLRASEVTGLQLDDIDWRAGEIAVRGKGRRVDRLPLPTDVGEAIAAYLSDGRPAAECRNVFVTLHAPTRPMHPNTVGRVVLFACRRAGLPPVRSHRLRHALATELLHQGVGLTTIGQVLRHRDIATTAKYAKVAMGSLRQVAQPWPEQAT